MLRPLALVCSAALLLPPPAGAADDDRLGRAIPEFSLSDFRGARHALSDWRDNDAIVVVFLGTECPLVKLYGRRLAEMSQRYAQRGVQFVGVNSNQQDTLREMEHFARTRGVEFPMLKDPDHSVSDLFGAERTPTAYVLDKGRRVRYVGRIDDQYGVGYARAEATRSELAEAIDDLLAGRPVSTPATTAVGCLIGRDSETAPTGDITYHNQIARLVQQHCVRCHREGQIAPFALAGYDDVAAWGETMREVIQDGRMPPWHAHPDFGEFSNDAAMTADEKRTFYQWVENGMPEGDPNDAPPPPEFATGWQIPKPDVVYRMPESFTVPAKGVVPYQYFVLDPGFEEDVWVRAAEIRPGAPSVVHHAFLFYLPPGQERPRDEDPLFNTVAAFAPGMPPALWPEGHARLIPAGSRLIFQMHYTPTGVEVSDRTRVGVVFAPAEQVESEVRLAIAVNTRFRIPPEAPAHRVHADYGFTQDVLLHTLIPHMHYRGKAFRFTARRPDGSEEVLLDVPRYDFNWQNAYMLAEPKRLAKGTVIQCTGVFDNSSDNLVNPDPTKEVRWGDQSWDEMMLGSFVYSLPEGVERGEYPRVTPLADGDSRVEFRYRPAERWGEARSVTLAGGFNDWDAQRTPMEGPDDEGYYRVSLNLAPGHYEYKFVINGDVWMYDPENPDRTGAATNSLLRVPAHKPE